MKRPQVMELIHVLSGALCFRPFHFSRWKEMTNDAMDRYPGRKRISTEVRDEGLFVRSWWALHLPRGFPRHAQLVATTDYTERVALSIDGLDEGVE